VVRDRSAEYSEDIPIDPEDYLNVVMGYNQEELVRRFAPQRGADTEEYGRDERFGEELSEAELIDYYEPPYS
jgi:hypothetical protein